MWEVLSYVAAAIGVIFACGALFLLFAGAL